MTSTSRANTLLAVLIALACLAPGPARACYYGGCGPGLVGATFELIGIGVLGLVGAAALEGALTLMEREEVRGRPDPGWATARLAVGGVVAAGGLAMSFVADEQLTAAGVGVAIGAAILLARGGLIFAELGRAPPDEPEAAAAQLSLAPGGLSLTGRF